MNQDKQKEKQDGTTFKTRIEETIDIKVKCKTISKDSFLYWYPKIKQLNIPQPASVIVKITNDEFKCTFDGMPKSLTQKVQGIISVHFNLPIFIRTDLASGKHSWKDSCFYDGLNSLWKNLYGVIEFNHMADIMGLPFTAIIIREYIPMDSRFTAFYGQMPVNPERRYFIDNGKVLCHHHYWIQEAITNPSIENWQEVLEEINIETPEEIKLLSDYAELIAKELSGFWSIDFCKAKDGRWILIDMATGERSWHPKDCHGDISFLFN
jgi:hypothetical protein